MNEQRTPDVGLDRLLTDWLEADAAPRAPESLETAVVEGVASTRQRPAWATTERWISMETRAQLGVMPRVAIALLTLALLAIGAIGGYAIGSGLVDASDGGDPRAGLTYSTYDADIYTHPTDSPDEPVRLTGADEGAVLPRWSPDGTRFAYQSWAGPGGPITITVRDADGSNPVAVGEPVALNAPGTKPNIHAWSPDGSRLVYAAKRLDDADKLPTCGRPSCGQWIWIAPTDGSELAQIISDPELDARAPVWTPDGNSIIFSARPLSETGYGLYRMDPDGGNVERIGDLAGDSGLDELSISPDGSTLAVFTGGAGGGGWKVSLVDLATGEDTLIAGEPGEEFEPYWSPDGSLIAFTNWGSVEPKPMLYDVASGEVTPLDTSLAVLGWSPDGHSILGQVLDGGRFSDETTFSMVDVTDPTAPVVTEVEGVTGAEWLSWRPRP
jgi:Tol biopolymer transport system component